MREGSSVVDKSKFATFASDFTPESVKLVKDSIQNKSVFRGFVKFGSDDLPGDTYRLVKKMINGEKFNKQNWDPLTPVTRKNVDKFLK